MFQDFSSCTTGCSGTFLFLLQHQTLVISRLKPYQILCRHHADAKQPYEEILKQPLPRKRTKCTLQCSNDKLTVLTGKLKLCLQHIIRFTGNSGFEYVELYNIMSCLQTYVLWVTQILFKELSASVFKRFFLHISVEKNYKHFICFKGFYWQINHIYARVNI